MPGQIQSEYPENDGRWPEHLLRYIFNTGMLWDFPLETRAGNWFVIELHVYCLDLGHSIFIFYCKNHVWFHFKPHVVQPKT
jgi:hypothetical protein